MKSLINKLRIYGPGKFVKYAISEVFRKAWLEPIKHSFSQNGEDLIIGKLFKNKKRGFYVDVGANDPKRFNNTKLFSLLGWKGINIEPNIHLFKKIEADRKKDTNLNMGIGLTDSKINFFEFFPDTLSTFSSTEAKKYAKMGYKLLSENQIKVLPLSSVLGRYAKKKKIDLMSIDTEGYDKIVLSSNDWKKYRPRVICIESVVHTFKGKAKDTGLEKILSRKGYRKIYDNGVNCIYIDKDDSGLKASLE